MFRDGEVVNISLSLDKSKAVKFLEEAVKKTLKKPVLKAAKKGKAPSDEIPEDTNVGRDKVPEPTSGDGSNIFGENMLMAWMRKPMETP